MTDIEELNRSLIMSRSSSSSSEERLGSSSSNLTSTQKTVSGLDALQKLLPTGTAFVFMFLSPFLSNNGKCLYINKVLMSILIAACGFSCTIASFTDSYTDSHGTKHYGIVTTRGLWTLRSPHSSSSYMTATRYKLKFADFVHAVLSVLVFAALAILDSNTVECFFPSIEWSENTLIAALPLVVSVVSSSVFTLFPITRHGIGYHSKSTRLGESSQV